MTGRTVGAEDGEQRDVVWVVDVLSVLSAGLEQSSSVDYPSFAMQLLGNKFRVESIK